MVWAISSDYIAVRISWQSQTLDSADEIRDRLTGTAIAQGKPLNYSDMGEEHPW
jgi:hypothetical protein